MIDDGYGPWIDARKRLPEPGVLVELHTRLGNLAYAKRCGKSGDFVVRSDLPLISANAVTRWRTA